MEKRIEITPKTILIFFAIAIGVLLLYFTRDILAILFIALIIVATLSPVIDWLTKYLKWRVVSVLVVYVIAFALISAFLASIVPTLSSQVQGFVTQLPQFTEQISWLKGFGQTIKDNLLQGGNITSITGYLTQSTTQFFQVTGSVIGIIASLLVIVVISFYGLVSQNNIKEELKKYLANNKLEKYWLISDKIYRSLGVWLRTQLLLAVIIGLIIGLGLYLLSVPYALLLGVLAGVLELIPVLGPVIASIPAIIIGLAVSPIIGLAVLILFIIVHQIESYILVPKVMEKVLGLSPVIILSALLIGAKLGGVVGAIIAVPLASAITILIFELPKKHEDTR